MNKETIKVKIEEMKKKNESDDEMSSNESKDIILEIRNDTNKVVSKKNMNGIYNSPLSKRRRRSSIINLINTLSPKRKINPNLIKLTDVNDLNKNNKKHKNNKILSSPKKKNAMTINSPVNNLEKEIENLVKLFLKFPLFKESSEKLFPYVKYILENQIMKDENLIILKNYLLQFPGLINIIKLKKKMDIEEIISKISLCLTIEKKNKNRIICLNGEIGNKFYLIFKGTVAILVPEEYEYELNEEEYLSHLVHLKEIKEYDILIRTIESNNKILSSEEIISIASEDFDFSDLSLDKEITLDNYLKRILPDENNEEENNNKYLIHPKKKITLWKYHKVCELNDGKTFGDIALSKYYNHRTATVISLNNCFFGILDKESYDICIKNLQERCRKDEINLLLSNNIFSEIDPVNFEKHFYNYFTKIRLKRQEIVFENGEEVFYIYFVFKGEIEIESNLSPFNLNYVYKKLTGRINEKEEKKIKRINNLYSEMDDYYHRNKLIRLIILKNEGIIGMNDFIIDGKYFCRGIVKSVYCDLFCIEKKFFIKVLKDEKKILRNYNKQQNEKINLMIERLKYLIKINIDNYYQKAVFEKEKSYSNNNNNSNSNSNNNNVIETFISERNYKIPSMKKTILNYNRKNFNKKKTIRYHNTRNRNNSRYDTLKTSENFLSYQFSERENSISNLNKSNKIILPNLKLKTRVFSNDNINEKINEYNKKDQENLIREKRNIPVPSLLSNTIKIKDKVINELIKHSKIIQSQSPITNNHNNNLIKNYYTLNSIDCLALDNYIQNYQKIQILSSPKMKGKKFIPRKIKKIEDIIY